MRIGVGFSCESDSTLAALQAAQQAIRQSGEPVITFLLTTDSYNQERVFKGVKDVIGKSKLVGACVPAIVTRAGIFQKGVGICTICGSSIEAVTHLQKNIGQSPYRSGEEAGRILRESGFSSGVVFVFPDGFAANISALLRGLYNGLGSDFSYIGGGTGDNLRFYQTYQFTEDGVSNDSLAVALVKGINFNVNLAHGWKPMGQPMMVTKAKGKKVYELDGLPAFDRYSACLGGISKKDFAYYSMKHPLGIPSAGNNFLIRDPLRVDDDNGIIFVTEVPPNTVATVMKGDTDTLLQAAENAAAAARSTPEPPRLALIFDCVSRYFLMDKDFTREIEVVVKNIGRDVPVLGMLSFGEISSTSGIPLFYNKTIVIAVGW